MKISKSLRTAIFAMLFAYFAINQPVFQLITAEIEKPSGKLPHQENYIVEQLAAFDWTKLRVDPRPWIGKRVTIEGWVGIHWGAQAQVAEVFLYESPEALRYKLNRRSMEVGYPEFLRSLEVEGIKPEAMAGTLLGKCVQIEAVLEESANSTILGGLSGRMTVRVVNERRVDMMGNIEDSK